MKPGPTYNILQLAYRAPGGVIRWHEAEAAYIAGSRPAQRHFARGEKNYGIWVKQVLGRHFVKVQGVRGHYVLRSKTYSEDPDNCRFAGEEWTTKEIT